MKYKKTMIIAFLALLLITKPSHATSPSYLTLDPVWDGDKVVTGNATPNSNISCTGANPSQADNGGNFILMLNATAQEDERLTITMTPPDTAPTPIPSNSIIDDISKMILMNRMSDGKNSQMDISTMVFLKSLMESNTNPPIKEKPKNPITKTVTVLPNPESQAHQEEGFGVFNPGTDFSISFKNGYDRYISVRDNRVNEHRIISSPIMDNNMLYVPIRPIANAFKINVSWNQPTKEVVLDKDNKTVVVDTIAGTARDTDNNVVSISDPKIKKGSTLVAAQDVGLLFGLSEDFYEINNDMIIIHISK